MLKQCVYFSVVVICGLQGAVADTIQLKDKAAVVGKVLSEKRDQVVVDVGYTVLVIPRNQIAKLSKSEDEELPAKTSKSPVVNETKDIPPVKAGFYSSPSRPGPIRNVRDLVNLL